MFYAVLEQSLLLAASIIPTLLLMDFYLLVRSSRKPGRLARWFPPVRGKSFTYSSTLIRNARESLSHLNVPPPPDWGFPTLVRWRLAHCGQWWTFLLLGALTTTALGASVGLFVSTHPRHQGDAFWWFALPSWTLQALCLLHTQLDKITMRRGQAEGYLWLSALKALIACGAHSRQSTDHTDRKLTQSVERLGNATVSYAQFGLPRYRGQAEIIAHADAMADLLSRALNETFRDRENVADLADHIVRLMTAVHRKEPLTMLPQGTNPVSANGNTDQVRSVSWPILGLHLLAFLVGCGLLLGLKWAGLEGGLLAFTPLVGLMCMLLGAPYAFAGKTPPRALREPHLTGTEAAASEDEFTSRQVNTSVSR